MRFRKAYLEISNVCNLSCSFCPGTRREPRFMSEEEFKVCLERLSPFCEYLYFHLLGEPLLHPSLERFLLLAHEKSFKVTITTNGTLIKDTEKILLSSNVYKVVFSLHSFEANTTDASVDKYLEDIFSFAKKAEGKMIVVFRLWNVGGANKENVRIVEKMKEFFPNEFKEGKGGIKIGDKVFLQYGDKFDWPDVNLTDECENVFCYGLRDQIGILADGTAVPCCLDNEGTISLGNIFTTPLDRILSTPRAAAIYEGFSKRCAAEELCRKCKYARRF